jgi:SAM-dependent methyltransferase
VSELASEHVRIQGYVEDVAPFLSGCRLSVAPLRYGAGVKGKVNQSMAHGLPCVATPIAVEGMDAKWGSEILVAETAQGLADHVISVYQQEDVWQEIASESIRNIERTFSMEVAEQKVKEILDFYGLPVARRGEGLPELDVGLAGYDDWCALTQRHPLIQDEESVLGIMAHAQRVGIESLYLGKVEPEEIEIRGPNYRESFAARGLNPRARVILDYFSSMSCAASPETVRIFAPEATTPFSRVLRETYPGFQGSEYMPDPAVRERLAPIPHEDLEALSFDEASFDVAFCNDVFEHVADLEQCLAELRRVLVPGGTLLATFPFAYDQHETIVKAVREGGEVRVIGEAEYHDDPVDPEGGTLVFQIPGWDILDRCREAGFSSAEFRFVSSRKRGITATELAGVFFLRAIR